MCYIWLRPGVTPCGGGLWPSRCRGKPEAHLGSPRKPRDARENIGYVLVVTPLWGAAALQRLGPREYSLTKPPRPGKIYVRLATVTELSVILVGKLGFLICIRPPSPSISFAFLSVRVAPSWCKQYT